MVDDPRFRLLREAISSLLFEVADVGALASRALRSTTVIDVDGDGTRLVACSVSHRKTYDIGVGSIVLPRVVGSVECEPQGDSEAIVRTLFADEPSAAVLLLVVALGYHRYLKADHAVSPAAQALLKRYYDHNKDDRELVIKSTNKDLGFLGATYKGPVPGPFDLRSALTSGDDLAKSFIDHSNKAAETLSKVKGWIGVVASGEFGKAYSDPEKTGLTAPFRSVEDLEEMLASTRDPRFVEDTRFLLDKLEFGADTSNAKLKDVVKKFISQNFEELSDLFDEVGYGEEFHDLLDSM